MTKYAIVDYLAATEPKPVVGWFDTDEFHAMSRDRYPSESLLECPNEVWEMRCAQSWGVTENKKFIKFTASNNSIKK